MQFLPPHSESPENIRRELVIRSFRSEDQEASKELILQGLAEHFGYIDTTLNLDLDNITVSYSQKSNVFLVAELQGELAGTAALVRLDEETGQIVRVSVAPRFRRQGVAASLVKVLLRVARERHLRRILVETNHDWYAAIELYKRLGFREFSRDSEGVYLELLW